MGFPRRASAEVWRGLRPQTPIDADSRNSYRPRALTTLTFAQTLPQTHPRTSWDRTVVDGIGTEQFLILPHPDVEQFIQFKTVNYDRWLGGMRKLRRNIVNQIGSTRLEDMHKLV